MIDDCGQRVKEAGPSTPVEILGLGDVPVVGSEISSEKTADATPTVETHCNASLRKGTRVLNLVLKSDVEGTLEAIRSAIQQPTVQFIHTATGEINESDVLLAQASEALILGFNVKISPDIKHLAKISGVEVRTYNIIYELLEDVEKALQGLLEKKEERDVRGEGEIIKLFTLPKSGDVVCGTRLDYGQIKIGDPINVLRSGEVVHSSKVKSLSVESEAKKKVSAGVNVGILIKPQFEFRTGDQLVIP
jgi:translation initiation factor IF-2